MFVRKNFLSSARGGKWCRSVQYVLLAFLLTGCGVVNTASVLAPVPNLYTFDTGDAYPAERVPEGLRQTTSEILYVTDRNPERGEGGAVRGYGTGRSDSFAFGSSSVNFGGLMSWQELVARTQSESGQKMTRLQSVQLQELTRFPDTPLPFERRSGQLRTVPDAEREYQARAAVMRREISHRMREHGQDRVLVYVHGINNEFEDSIGVLANIWHYSGRQSLPVAYSWPAGNEGILKYFRDVESSEFSVFHVKEFLRMLASVPEVRRIDIVAHSRGNVVTTNALRELQIEARASGRDPQKALKTGILVMAAPDLDVGVARQRLLAEHFAEGFDHINIYVNPNDEALRLSSIIGDVVRLGNVSVDSFRMKDIDSLTSAGNISFIVVEQAGGRLGHSYFRENPAVLSDIVLTLRSRQAPGTAFRPLEIAEGNMWVLHPNYPAAPLPDVLDVQIRDR